MTVKKQQIDINKVNAKRAISPHDNLDELVADFTEHGQRMPLIVDENLNLIDGLRRLHAAFKNRQTEVTVVVCPTLEDTCHWLTKTVADGKFARTATPQRLYQLFTDTYEQQKARGDRIRHKQRGMPRGTRAGQIGEQRSRAMLNEAIGLGPGEAQLAQSTFIYKQFIEYQDDEEYGPFFAKVRADLEAGKISLYSARGAIDRALKSDMSGNIVELQDQRNALATALNQLSGTTKALSHFGEINPEMDKAELLRYLQGFQQGRRALSSFITSLKKRVTTP